MLQYLIQRVSPSSFAEFSLNACVRDACVLATFTGSRVSEYAQSQLPKGQSFNIVPHNAASGDQGGTPLAFLAEDFTFYDKSQVTIPWSKAQHAAYVAIRFRYTKGVHIFTKRMFSNIYPSPFCPVAAAFRAVRRWATIAPGQNTPVFCYLSAFFSKKASYLADFHITSALRTAVTKVYPSERHILRSNINAISAHSLRVFACLCLRQSGWDEDTISYQLRWNSDAIKHYIRQSVTQVDAIGASMLASALVSINEPTAKTVSFVPSA